MFYLDLFKSLEKHQVEYLLVGGLAMNLHGVPRMTMDVDLILALNEKNLDRFFLVVDDLALTPAFPIALEDLKSPEQKAKWIKEKNMSEFSMRSKDARGPSLDILIAHPLDWKESYQRGIGKIIEGTTINLAAIQDMIRLKEFAGRAQDLSDLEHLKKMTQ